MLNPTKIVERESTLKIPRKRWIALAVSFPHGAQEKTTLECWAEI
jgi:hypothetical protein